MSPKPVDAKSPPTALQALWGSLAAGLIALILYKFTTTVGTALNRQTLSDNFSLGVDTVPLLTLLDKILPIYKEVIAELKEAGASWIQFDEPTLVLDLDSKQLTAFITAYSAMESSLSRRIIIILFFV